MTRPSRHRSARLVAILLAGSLTAGCGSSVAPTGPLTSTDPTSGAATPAATPRPAPGHELYGFVPYWEMDGTIVQHLSGSPVATIALFSVTTTGTGVVDASKPGYKKIVGPTGRSIVNAVHDRGGRIDLVFSSFGTARNKSFFRKPAVQEAAITSLLELAQRIGADGLSLDVEQLDATLLGAYGDFVSRLRTALFAAMPAARLTVATGASAGGAAIAAAAIAAGADRVFLMGYDYRVVASEPGATSPLRRADGGHDLAWSLDTYAALGVPPQRTLLGLPLYGIAWPVAGPGLGAPATGPGAAWVPADHADFLAASAAKAVYDEIEGVDVYFVASDGSVGVPTPSAPPSPAATLTWKAIYVDSPGTLVRKLALGQEYGLAGAGFWAMGYERGLPGYTEMLSAYLKGAVLSAN